MVIDFQDQRREFFDIIYKTVGQDNIYLDLYYPKKINQNMPVFIYIHGGGFLWYDKTLIDQNYRINHVRYKNRLLKLGFVFVSVEYRRDKIEEYPCIEAQIEDVKDAIRWIKKNASSLRCDANNIGLWGLSAGGALALGAVLNNDDDYSRSVYNEYDSKVQYVIDFYGITDIYAYYNLDNFNTLDEQAQQEKSDFIYRHTNILVTNKHEFKTVKKLVDNYSPLYNIKQCDTPISIYHGTKDLQVDYNKHALKFYNKSIKIGNKIRMYTFEEKDHGFWWDTAEFYETLENHVIEEIQLYASESHNDI